MQHMKEHHCEIYQLFNTYLNKQLLKRNGIPNKLSLPFYKIELHINYNNS